jgi:membrane-associated phospholipid phosphatase
MNFWHNQAANICLCESKIAAKSSVLSDDCRKFGRRSAWPPSKTGLEHHGSALKKGSCLSSASALVFASILTLACCALFAAAPQLDLVVAQNFFSDGHFTGLTPLTEQIRRMFFDAPYALLVLLLLAYAARRRNFRRLGFARRGPDGRAILFLVATLALGPGLLVNGLLKENSHRPRPEQTVEFGGPWRFRPFENFDGDCRSNCSFASGEVSASAWTLAPALLAPPAFRVAAIGAALLFTAATALLRMSFGGHYLSDALLSALFTFLIVLTLDRWYLRRP